MEIRLTKYGVMYSMTPPEIHFQYHSGGLGTFYLTDNINKVQSVLKKPVKEIDIGDLITHPYATFETEEDGERLFNRLKSMETIEQSVWGKAMTKEEKEKWIEFLHEYDKTNKIDPVI